MRRATTIRRTRCWIVCLFAALVQQSGAMGQEAGGPANAGNGQAELERAPRLAEVIGDDVYVRSGPSLNHYPMDKLKAGDRVTVVGETGDWCEILPPDGLFSFISGDYVDTVDERTGIVNGNQVRVRAGSALPPFAKLKYVVQTKLAKGSEVTILGREPDGFLRIKPPVGTSVWINHGYVEYVPETASSAAPIPVAVTDSDAGEPKAAGSKMPGVPDTPKDDKAAVGSQAAYRSTLAGLPPTEARDKLENIEEAARAEVAKPVSQRNFEPLIQRYKAVADAEADDSLAQRYALARVQQLSQMNALIDTVRRMRKLDDEAATKRRGFLEGRAKIRETLPPIPSEVDAQGELRVSALYPPGSPLRRYRLVDATGARERTIAYVEIPQDSTIAVEAFLGHYIGVRASGARLQTGGVDPIPIYVAGELILLQPPTTTERTVE